MEVDENFILSLEPPLNIDSTEFEINLMCNDKQEGKPVGTVHSRHRTYDHAIDSRTTKPLIVCLNPLEIDFNLIRGEKKILPIVPLNKQTHAQIRWIAQVTNYYPTLL